MLCAAATWFVARAVLNRLVHALKGNSLPAVLVELVGGEATFAVQGKRGQAMHKVWVRLGSNQSACGCKAFLQEGACGQPFRWVWCEQTWLHQLRRVIALRSSARG